MTDGAALREHARQVNLVRLRALHKKRHGQPGYESSAKDIEAEIARVEAEADEQQP